MATIRFMSDAISPQLKLDLVILDCPDALALARFYAEILGWEVEEGADRELHDPCAARRRGEPGQPRWTHDARLSTDR